jgi:biotin transport system substrate-specific component
LATTLNGFHIFDTQLKEPSMSSTATLRAVVAPRSTALTHALFIVGGVGFIAAMAQISIPVPGSPVPVTGQTLAALLVGTTYGARLAVTTFATYIFAGIAGAPIFAPSATSANHGLDRVMSATGGYLIGMLLASLLLGYLADRKADQKFATSFPALLLGEVVIFGTGLVWLHNSLELSWSATISAGLTPFILGEFLKIAIVGTSLPLIWRKIATALNK